MCVANMIVHGINHGTEVLSLYSIIFLSGVSTGTRVQCNSILRVHVPTFLKYAWKVYVIV